MKQNDAYSVVIQTINAASQLPVVKVHREEFLRNQFKDSRYLDSILEHGPQIVFTPEALRKRAEKIIKDSTAKTSFTSFVAGLPSNPVTSVVAGGAESRYCSIYGLCSKFSSTNCLFIWRRRFI